LHLLKTFSHACFITYSCVMFTNEELVDLLGSHRLEAYFDHSGPGPAEATQLYKRNIKLATALWPSIDVVEVLIRNRLARRLFPTGFVSKQELERLTSGKYNTSIFSNDDLVSISEFPFGFWVYLLAPENTDTAWTPSVHKEFLPKTKRHELHEDLSRIKSIRNKVGHHEPLWRIDLADFDQRVSRVLGTISPHALEWHRQITAL